MLRTMLKPKWLAFLALVLVVVVAFLLLGRWQLTAAFESSGTAADAEAYVEPVPLGELIAPDTWVTDEAAARPVVVEGFLVPGDFGVVEGRLQDGVSGFWVVGHFAVTDDGTTDFGGVDASELPGMPVALGWVADESQAAQAITTLDASDTELGSVQAPLSVLAKLEVGQDPVPARDGDPQRILSMSPGQLINTWATGASDFYPAWLLATAGLPAPAPLDAIAVVPIDDSLQIDLLNIFYAIEWLVFCVMAIYIWWRMVRDDYVTDKAEQSDAAVAERVRRELLLELANKRDRER
jgi:cytochrome oxidase assembly protein ShyY1